MLEIPCGKLNFDKTTKKVTPDNSKGKIILTLVFKIFYIIRTTLMNSVFNGSTYPPIQRR